MSSSSNINTGSSDGQLAGGGATGSSGLALPPSPAQCSYFLPLASGSAFFRLPALTVDGVTCCHCAAVQALLEAKNMRLLATPYKGRMLGQ